MNKPDSPLETEHGLLVQFDGLSNGQERHSFNKSVDMAVQLEWCESVILPLALCRAEELQYSFCQDF